MLERAHGVPLLLLGEAPRHLASRIVRSRATSRSLIAVPDRLAIFWPTEGGERLLAVSPRGDTQRP